MMNAFEIKSAHAQKVMNEAAAAMVAIERADGDLDVEAWVKADEAYKAAVKAWGKAVEAMVEAHLAGLR